MVAINFAHGQRRFKVLKWSCKVSREPERCTYSLLDGRWPPVCVVCGKAQDRFGHEGWHPSRETCYDGEFIANIQLAPDKVLGKKITLDLGTPAVQLHAHIHTVTHNPDGTATYQFSGAMVQ